MPFHSHHRRHSQQDSQTLSAGLFQSAGAMGAVGQPNLQSLGRKVNGPPSTLTSDSRTRLLITRNVLYSLRDDERGHRLLPPFQ